MEKATLIRRIISYMLVLTAAPVMVVLFATVMPRRSFLLVAIVMAVVAVGAFCLNFEKEKDNGARTVLTAVFAALSTASRVVFAAVPGFKPIMSVTMFAGMYLGGDAGFLVGALTALLSNFVFGQGGWTPFQMLLWGLIGVAGGLFAPVLKKSKIALCIGGALSGILFSLLIDVWSTVWMKGTFSLPFYLGVITEGLPFTITYAVSNVIFMLILAEPMRKTMERAAVKFGIEEFRPVPSRKRNHKVEPVNGEGNRK